MNSFHDDVKLKMPADISPGTASGNVIRHRSLGMISGQNAFALVLRKTGFRFFRIML